MGREEDSREHSSRAVERRGGGRSSRPKGQEAELSGIYYIRSILLLALDLCGFGFFFC